MSLDPTQFLDMWDDSGARPGAALQPLLQALAGEGAALAQDTLGQRNHRLLALHDAVVGGPLDAVVACPACGEEEEFALPLAELRAAPAGSAAAEFSLGSGQCFRLPRLADIAVARGAADPAQAIAQACRIAGEDKLEPALLTQFGAQCEELDPAGSIVVNIACSHCAAAIAAAVDLAPFVERGVARAFDRLLREIDLIARHYGWSEAAIAGLPRTRRQRYVAMISAAQATAAAPVRRVRA